MAVRDDYPNQDNFDELQEVIERVDEDPTRVEKVVKAAAVDMEFLLEMPDLY